MKDNSLGESLRSEREKRGITIEQIASATKISVKLLHYLESDQYSELPAKPFVRGFVISYSRFVGLDPKEILTRFSSFIDEKSHDRPKMDAGHSGYAFERKDGERSRTMLWVLMGSCILFGGIVMFVLKPALKHRNVSHIEKLRTAYTGKNNNPVVEAVTKIAEAEDKAKKEELSKNSQDELKLDIPALKDDEAQKEDKDAKEYFKADAPKIEPANPVKEEIPEKAEKTEKVEKEKTDKFASAEPTRTPNPEDPLHKGDSLAAEDIRYKLVLRAIENLWVRYQVDDHPVMKFLLLKDKLIVFRAGDVIKVQVSDPEEVEFRHKSEKYTRFDKAKSLASRNGLSTMIVPSESIEKYPDPFPGATAFPPVPENIGNGAASNENENH